jgi:hypothetical protein
MLPLTYACLHDEVRVLLADGRTLQGWSVGAEWWSTPDGPEAYMEIEPRGGALSVVSREELISVTPVGGYREKSDFLEAVAQLVDTVPGGASGESLRLITGDHETVEITVERHATSCSPGVAPTRGPRQTA